jgi:hypothetical protein
MDFSTLILFFVYIVNLCLLIFMVFHKDRQRSWPFFWMLLLLILWQTTELLNVTWFINKDKSLLLLTVQAGLLPALYLAPSFIYLVFSLFDKWGTVSAWRKFLWWLPAIVMSGFVFTSYNVSDVIVSDNRFFYIAGPIYWFFAVYFLSLMAYGFYILSKNRRSAGAIVRRQIVYIFVGTILASLVGLIFNILFPILGWSNLYYLGVNSTIFFTAILTYALFRHRFYNLKISFYQILINLLKLLIIGFIYYIFYIIFHDLIRLDFNSTNNVVFLLLVLGLTAPFILNIINRMLLSLFISPEHDIKVSSDRITDILRSSRDLDILLARLSREINKVVNYKEIFVYLSKKKETSVFYQVFPVGERLLNKSDSDLIQYLSKKKRMANQAELEYFFNDKMLVQEMKDMNIDVALPIFYNKQLLGVLMINNDGELLSIQELNFLKELNKYLDIAVGSLLLYQQDMAGK